MLNCGQREGSTRTACSGLVLLWSDCVSAEVSWTLKKHPELTTMTQKTPATPAASGWKPRNGGLSSANSDVVGSPCCKTDKADCGQQFSQQTATFSGCYTWWSYTLDKYCKKHPHKYPQINLLSPLSWRKAARTQDTHWGNLSLHHPLEMNPSYLEGTLKAPHRLLLLRRLNWKTGMSSRTIPTPD